MDATEIEVLPIDEVEPFGQEDETDLAANAKNGIGRAFITGTDWTTETILSQLRQGNIDLSPSFQRRDAWGCGRPGVK